MKLKTYLFILISTFILLGNSLLIGVQSTMNILNYEISKKGMTTILLSNGVQCIYNDNDLFTNDGWQIGDNVNFVYTYFDGYFLENLSFQGCAPVEISDNIPNDASFLTIKSILPKKDGDVTKNTIILNDGSQWYIGSWSSSWMQNWQPNDRIIVNPQDFLLGQADYFLINIDRLQDGIFPANVRAQLLYDPIPEVTIIDKRPVTTWPHYIAAISLKNNNTLIQFDNGLLCECYDINNYELRKWNIGDEVTINNKKLINVKTNLSTDIKIINSDFSSIEALSIKSIKSKGIKIVLGDGTIWFKNSYGNDNWQPGDRVIVFYKNHASIDTSTHVLLNLDKINNKDDFPSTWNVTLVR